MEQDTSCQIFDPRKYLEKFFSYLNKKPGEEPELLEFLLTKLHEYMQEVPNGETIVNFGCGPTIHCNISASAKFKRIICAEYTEANRKELQKWLSVDKDMFDWSVFFKYVSVLEGQSETEWKSLEERVRSTTKEIVPCDVLKDPVIDHPDQPFDAIVTTLCIEETCHDFQGFKNNIRRLVSVLKAGGYLFIATMLFNTGIYTVNGLEISTVTLNKEQVKEAVRDAGLDIMKASLYTSCTDDPAESEVDFSYVLFILAIKKS